jgi:hypothetical protein
MQGLSNAGGVGGGQTNNLAQQAHKGDLASGGPGNYMSFPIRQIPSTLRLQQEHSRAHRNFGGHSSFESGGSPSLKGSHRKIEIIQMVQPKDLTKAQP